MKCWTWYHLTPKITNRPEAHNECHKPRCTTTGNNRIAYRIAHRSIHYVQIRSFTRNINTGKRVFRQGKVDCAEQGHPTTVSNASTAAILTPALLYPIQHLSNSIHFECTVNPSQKMRNAEALQWLKWLQPILDIRNQETGEIDQSHRKCLPCSVMKHEELCQQLFGSKFLEHQLPCQICAPNRNRFLHI